mmetsp:Transcript_18256/g.72997  ORF Transcript_18256/g.72997 Transcript_18256/m.72997 type:complete len:260 (-) Transcript_18256:44-823(-)
MSTLLRAPTPTTLSTQQQELVDGGRGRREEGEPGREGREEDVPGGDREAVFLEDDEAVVGADVEVGLDDVGLDAEAEDVDAGREAPRHDEDRRDAGGKKIVGPDVTRDDLCARRFGVEEPPDAFGVRADALDADVGVDEAKLVAKELGQHAARDEPLALAQPGLDARRDLGDRQLGDLRRVPRDVLQSCFRRRYRGLLGVVGKEAPEKRDDGVRVGRRRRVVGLGPREGDSSSRRRVREAERVGRGDDDREAESAHLDG